MTARFLKPNSNWHRLVHLLDRNDGTLYLAQLYKPKAGQAAHPEVITDGMPQLTEYALLDYRNRYEKQAALMGWVNIQRHRNRTWVTLLPRGREALKAFAKNEVWNTRTSLPATEEEYGI